MEIFALDVSFKLELKEIDTLAKAKANNQNKIVSYMDRTAYMAKMFSHNAHPYAFIMVSENFVSELAGAGLDLYNDNNRATMMNELLVSCTLIYQPTTDIMSVMFNGERTSVKYKVDDYILQSSKLQKELNEFIRLNKN